MTSCASSSRSLQRKFRARTYRFCKPTETKNYIGKLCYRWCKERAFFSNKCKVMATDIIEVSKYHDKLLNAGFVVISRDRT